MSLVNQDEKYLGPYCYQIFIAFFWAGDGYVDTRYHCLDDVHFCVLTGGCEASSRLACPNPL